MCYSTLVRQLGFKGVLRSPFPVDTGRKLNVLCTFNLRPLSTELCGPRSKSQEAIAKTVFVYPGTVFLWSFSPDFATSSTIP